MILIKQQAAKDKVWQDEQGTSIPYSRTTPIERMKEKYAYEIANAACKLNHQLTGYKARIQSICDELFDTVMSESEKKKATKGNFTWYNFNGSIKIEVSINENIDFDGMLIEKAKQKLLELVSEGINEKKEFLKELVLSAFQTSKGKLDTKKIFGLKKHASRISDKRFQEAMILIDQSIRRPSSTKYFRVWLRNEAGKYENVDLNFSSI